MRKLLVWFIGCVCAAAEGPSGIDRLTVYKGTWKIQTEQFDTRYSKAKKESSTLKNDCWRSGPFFVCNQFVDGESRDLIVFTYDAKDDTYNSYTMPSGGGKGGSGKLLIKDNVWTFPWKRREPGRIIYFQVVNTFRGPNTIEYLQEFSEDKVNWTVTAKGLEKKHE